ncbi:MAG: zinc ribbon domain-containing protein [Gemmatimonadales bacterium]
MLELIVGVVLAAGATYYVLLPILRPPVPTPAGAAESDEGDDPDDDMSLQTVALRALKEIEFDRATGKLSDTDYEALKAKYTEEALVAMRGEQGAGSREQGAKPAKPAPRSPLPAPSCPEHGPRPEPDAVFCSTCGRRLGSAPAYCARCGTTLEKDARYCDRCGSRVAA